MFSQVTLTSKSDAPVLTPSAGKTISLRSALLSFSLAALTAALPFLSALADENVLTQVAPDRFSERYTAITKEILVGGIELERFNLQYRRACLSEPKWRTLRYAASQEAGAAGLLGYELTADKQLGLGKRNPDKVGESALRGGLASFFSTAIISGAGSGFELASNLSKARKDKRQGLDYRSACRYFLSKSKELDSLLAEREDFVTANANHPGYERALIEGKILRLFRQAQIFEFAQLTADASELTTSANAFYILNIVSNTLAAIASGYQYKSVREPKFTPDSGITLTLSGAVAAVSPLLSQQAGTFARKRMWRSLCRDFNATPHFDSALLTQERTKLQELAAAESAPALMPRLPGLERVAMYTEASQLIITQIKNESRTMRHLKKVALQQDIPAPVIGGALMTEGITALASYYGPKSNPKRQLAIDFGGTIAGDVGASVGVVATPAFLLADLTYARKQQRENRSPEQLIKARLEHLDQVEKIVLAL
jgi:hypothetical protein